MPEQGSQCHGKGTSSKLKAQVSAPDRRGHCCCTAGVHLVLSPGPSHRPLKTAVKEEDQNLIMEVDTGASVTVISEATWGRIWPTQPDLPLHLTDVKLRTYTGEAIPVVGKLMVKVQYQGQEEELFLVVIVGDGPSLLGRDWLAKLKHIFNVQAQESLQDALQQHGTVFKPDMGVEAKFHINIVA